MVSSTPCCKKQYLDLRGSPRGWMVLAASWLLWCCCMALPTPARAQAQPLDSSMRIERSDDGVYLSTTLSLELPTLVEDALYKGIAMYFVMEAEVARERWYWPDQQVAQAVRYLRLSYQPLTRRWRLNVSPTPFEKTGLGVLLNQNFDDLAEALDAMQRIAHWKIAEPAAVAPGTRYRAQLSFRLDLSQLPRPLQIGALGRSGWDMGVVRSQLLVVEPSP